MDSTVKIEHLATLLLQLVIATGSIAQTITQTTASKWIVDDFKSESKLARVMDREGGQKHAVSNETFRMVNSPAWSPDRNHIAVRKHFTGTRSLGAGEIWMYPATGGEGVQLTKRPNQQKDMGEPAFSPDGRYVYYSQDVTPGDIFEYSKDSEQGIYVIKRVDVKSREV